MATLIPAKQIDFKTAFSGSTEFGDIFISGNLVVSQSAILGTSIDTVHQIVGSVEMSGSLALSGGLVINDISITESFIQFTNDNEIVGIITASSDGLLINGTLFGDNLIIGNYSGSGDNIFFNRVGTNESTDSVMVIGNYFNEYENKQTTIFPNAELIISGSVELTNGGYIILNPLITPPSITENKGGIYYSIDGCYYLKFN
jgi:hypothetical protein